MLTRRRERLIVVCPENPYQLADRLGGPCDVIRLSLRDFDLTILTKRRPATRARAAAEPPIRSTHQPPRPPITAGRGAARHADGTSSRSDTAIIAPATPSSANSSTSGDRNGDNTAADNPAASGSTKPVAAATTNARSRDRVAAYTDDATATPSGTLCIPMAKAINAALPVSS